MGKNVEGSDGDGRSVPRVVVWSYLLLSRRRKGTPIDRKGNTKKGEGARPPEKLQTHGGGVEE